MDRDAYSQSNNYAPVNSYEYHNPLMVKGVSDLLALAGIWVVLILVGQVAIGIYMAEPIGKCLGLPVLQAGASLVVAYLALDVVTYLCLRGRLIFQWMVPALCLAAAAAVPGLVVYLAQAIHTL